MTNEVLIDSQLECVDKREMTRRGVRYTQIKLRRSGGHMVKFTFPVKESEIQIGGYYKIAILPDSAPEPPELPQLNPGDHVHESWKWAGVKVWRPAVFLGLTPKGRAIVRAWKRGPAQEYKVSIANLTPASGPFPSIDDMAVPLPGDTVLWRGKKVTLAGFVSSDQAVVWWELIEPDGSRSFQTQHKLVPRSQVCRFQFGVTSDSAARIAGR